MQLLVEVDRENSSGAVVRDALENLGEICDPEWALESRADFFNSLCERQKEATSSRLAGSVSERQGAIVAERNGNRVQILAIVAANETRRAGFRRLREPDRRASRYAVAASCGPILLCSASTMAPSPHTVASR